MDQLHNNTESSSTARRRWFGNDPITLVSSSPARIPDELFLSDSAQKLDPVPAVAYSEPLPRVTRRDSGPFNDYQRSMRSRMKRFLHYFSTGHLDEMTDEQWHRAFEYLSGCESPVPGESNPAQRWSLLRSELDASALRQLLLSEASFAVYWLAGAINETPARIREWMHEREIAQM